jgi:GT2 family glycosyltransferase
MKTVIGILNYNNEKLTNRLVENLHTIANKTNKNIIVFDNGSEPNQISKYTTHRIETNCRMTCGFNHIIDIINQEHNDYDYIWFFTNDCFFNTTNDPIEDMVEKFNKIDNLGILHPALSHAVNVCYDVKKDKNKTGVKIVCDYDFVCPMFSKKAMNAIGNVFNKDLNLGWGLDYESSYLVRKQGLLVGINHNLEIMHNTSSTYDMGLDNMFSNRDLFYTSAGKEMYDVFNKKYGLNWHYKFTSQNIERVGTWYE